MCSLRAFQPMTLSRHSGVALPLFGLHWCINSVISSPATISSPVIFCRYRCIHLPVGHLSLDPPVTFGRRVVTFGRCDLEETRAWAWRSPIGSVRRLPGPGHGRRPPREITVGVIASSVRHKFHNELVSIGSQKPPRIPGDRLPSANGYRSINEWNGMNLCARDQDPLGKHGNAMSACRQGDERLRCGAIEAHARLDARGLAGGVEPFARGK